MLVSFINSIFKVLVCVEHSLTRFHMTSVTPYIKMTENNS